MTKQVQRRRGTASQHTSFTGAEGELSVNTTNKSVHVHDGVTAGGVEAARADLANVSDANLNAALSGNTLSSLTITTADINGGTIDGTVIGGSTPAAITGTTITGTSFVTSGDMTFGDNDKAIFGAGSDLQIYHDGANSYISDSGTGRLELRGSTEVRIASASGEAMLRAFENSNVSLYYDNALKLATTATGIDVTGTVTADGLTVDGNISATGGDLNLATLDLNAIAASKAVTAVDVFVYDTSRDSDGGAWRKRTQHTSWYNETLNTATRGSRREFPAVAVIVSDATTLTIYDGDDPSLPMWMVFEVAASKAVWLTASSVTMLNGKLVLGHLSGYGVSRIDFLSETSVAYAAINYLTNKSLPLAQRNYGASFVTQPDGQAIVNATVNDVAMTVLPDAPIDPATGLPVPTIAVATAGGVSVIKDDGTVVDITRSARAYAAVQFAGTSLWVLETIGTASAWIYFNSIPASDVVPSSEPSYINSGYSTNYILPSNSYDEVAGDGRSTLYLGGAGDLTLISGNTSQKTAGSMVAYATSTYNTGWMNGDIKGAFLADTDDTDLVASGELVTNGDFATASDWTLETGWSITGGQLVNTTGATGVFAYQGLTTVAGKRYVVTVDVASVSGTLQFLIRDTNQFGTVLTGADITAAGSRSFTFVATSNTTFVRFGDYFTSVAVNSVSVKLADADRSVNNNGLIVNGTVTRTAVATGAELVAYSGFSAANYLEQPYNSDLDFGTGDFCVMGWVKGATTLSTTNIVSRGSSGTNGFQLYKNTTSGTPSAIFRLGTTLLYGTTGITNQWNHVVAVRNSGVAYIYKNGVLESSVAATADVSGSYVTQVGWSTTNPTIAALEGISLLRISATAPTAEQIAKIYEDEKVLFQENAACTLYGPADAVTALAHDPVTDLLHVGTSAGRSVFQGLRRVSNTTTAVGTAISASNSLVVEE